jgi:hypothetical protein
MLIFKFGGFEPRNILQHFSKAIDWWSEKSAFTKIPQEKFNEEYLQQIFTSLLSPDATSSEPKGFYIETEENLKRYLDELQKLSEENQNILKRKITIVLPKKLYDSELAQQCDNKKTKAERIKYLIENNFAFNIEVDDPQEIKDILSDLDPNEKEILATSSNCSLSVKFRPDFGASTLEWTNLEKMTEIFTAYIKAFSEPKEGYESKVLIITHSTGGVAASLPSRMGSVEGVSFATIMTSPFFWYQSNWEDTMPLLFGIAGQPNDKSIMIEVRGLPQLSIDLQGKNKHNFISGFIAEKGKDILKAMEEYGFHAISIVAEGDPLTNAKSMWCTVAPPESIKVTLPEDVEGEEVMNALLQEILTAISKRGAENKEETKPGEVIAIQQTAKPLAQDQQSLSPK